MAKYDLNGTEYINITEISESDSSEQMLEIINENFKSLAQIADVSFSDFLTRKISDHINAGNISVNSIGKPGKSGISILDDTVKKQVVSQGSEFISFNKFGRTVYLSIHLISTNSGTQFLVPEKYVPIISANIVETKILVTEIGTLIYNSETNTITKSGNFSGDYIVTYISQISSVESGGYQELLDNKEDISNKVTTITEDNKDSEVLYTSVKSVDERITERITTKADLISGIIPSSQLPSYVDDIVEGTYVNATTFIGELGILTLESGKIYVDITNMSVNHQYTQYRWSGTALSPVTNTIGFATQAEAETASTTENTKIATLLRVSQAFKYWITNLNITTLTTNAKTIIGSINELFSALTTHINKKDNPHDTTLAQVTNLPITIEQGGTGSTTKTWEDKIKTTTIIYVDSNREDSYTEDGTINRPYKKLSTAITANDSSPVTIILATGTYTEISVISFPDYPIHIIGNGSTISMDGYSLDIQNGTSSLYNLVINGNLNYMYFEIGSRHLLVNTTVTGILTTVSIVDAVNSKFNNSHVNIMDNGQLFLHECTATSYFIQTGSGLLDIRGSDIEVDYASYAVLSTGGCLKVQSSTIINTNSTGGCISCNNGSNTSTPNNIVDNVLTTLGTGYGLLSGTAVTVYSKNNISTTNHISGTALVAVNTDLIGINTIMQLGDDAAGDVYYRGLAGQLSRLPIGDTGQSLKVSSSGLPEYQTDSSEANAKLAMFNPATVVDVMNLQAGEKQRIPQIFITKTGRIFSICSSNSSEVTNHGSKLISKYSDNAGRTWSARRILITPTETGETEALTTNAGIVNASFLSLDVINATGEIVGEKIVIFYTIINDDRDWEVVTYTNYLYDFGYIMSEDDGETWSSFTSIKSFFTNNETFGSSVVCVFTGLSSGIKMKNGAYVIPFQVKLSNSNETPESGAPYSIQSLLMSTSNFSTFIISELVPAYTSECGVYEWKEGYITINCRGYMSARRVFEIKIYKDANGDWHSGSWAEHVGDKKLIEPTACNAAVCVCNTTDSPIVLFANCNTDSATRKNITLKASNNNVDFSEIISNLENYSAPYGTAYLGYPSLYYRNGALVCTIEVRNLDNSTSINFFNLTSLLPFCYSIPAKE